MRALRITKCSDSLMWYASHVGKIVPLVGEYHSEYLSREPAGYTNIIKKGDAEIIDVHPDQIFFLSVFERLSRE